MKKYFLVTKIGDGKTKETAFRPGYVDDGKINNVCVDVGNDTYLVLVNTKDSDKLTWLAQQPGVVELDNTKQKKKEVKTLLKLTKDIKEEEHIVDAVGKIAIPDFHKDKINVIEGN